jgi:hypothetical protein
MKRTFRRKRALKRSLGLAVAGVLLAAGAVYALSEIGPEVVTVETFSPDGASVSTRLWIVDAEGHPWLRSALPWTHEWLDRMEQRPRVVVHRVTGAREFNAVLVREPHAVERVDALMRSKYGLRDLLLRDLVAWLPGLVDTTDPIRLDPVGVQSRSGNGTATRDEQAPTPEPAARRWRAGGAR